MCGEKHLRPASRHVRPGSPPRVRGKAKVLEDPRSKVGITPACAGKSELRLWLKALREDHPRVCGEKGSRTMAMSLQLGSPPRVRGKGSLQHKTPPDHRITPACAGKRAMAIAAFASYRDHPRVCGEKVSAFFFGLPPRDHPRVCGEKLFSRSCHTRPPGSPPRVRGKVRPRCSKMPLSGDHPRVCGEKANVAESIRQYGGSPPRVRGKVLLFWTNHRFPRITPACAGKSTGDRIDGIGRRGSPPRVRGKGRFTVRKAKNEGITPACAGKRCRPSERCEWPRDHPRVCGEKSFVFYCRLLRLGSPPRVRGKVSVAASAAAGTGITPACAGKRFYAANNTAMAGDHPRVCGEKRKRRGRADVLLGSPPRVRGKEFHAFFLRLSFWITPACAGKRPRFSHRARRARDHPRVCGEKNCRPLDLSIRSGSPPRVRGKGLGVPVSSGSARITPACAGKSPSDP